MATKEKAAQNGQTTATASEANRHGAADHPELDDPEFLKELVHTLLHRVEVLESRLLGPRLEETKES